MVNEPQSSDLLHPLHGHSILYPFARTFRDSNDAPKPNGSSDLESIHNYMKSRALMSPDKLFQEAKTIVDGGLELLNSKFASFAAPENKNEAVPAKGKENPPKQRQALAPAKVLKSNKSEPSVHLEPSLDIDQLQDAEEYLLVPDKLKTFKNNNDAVAAKGNDNTQVRRPGLGRKRARFSLKPKTSQPSISLEPSLDIDQLQDPEEFFSAFEKIEYAKREIQRQMGGNTTDLSVYNPSTNTRRRRPGILGRSVSYKHSYSSVLSENDDTLISSQETLQQDIPSSSQYDSQQDPTDPNVKSQEKESDGSRAKVVNRVSEFWDELLSSNNEISDGDGALSRLQEELQIKPIDLDKLSLPDLHDIRTDFVVLGEKSPKTRSTISYMNKLVKGLSCKTPYKHKQVAESPTHPITSCTPPKSPFAALSLLKKRISQSIPMSDPFSALNIDPSPTRNLSSVEVFDRQSDQIDTSKKLSNLDKSKSVVEDAITNSKVANTGSQTMIGGDSLNLFDKSVNESPSKVGVGIGVRSSGSHDDLEDHDRSNNMDQGIMDDHASTPNVDIDVWTHRHNNMEENMQGEDMLHEAASHAQPDINIEGSTRSYTNTDVRPHGLSEMEVNVEDMQQETAASEQPDIIIEDSTMENLNNGRTQLGQKNATTDVDHALEGPSASSEINPEQQNEDHPRTSLNERSKARRPREGRQRKVLSRRKSLAEAGSLWKSGVRRSSRITRRPLEYWKGERFLYGRVHESLPTVIGVKYISPAKGDEKPTFRVKSFVSDDYKELVELAALH